MTSSQASALGGGIPGSETTIFHALLTPYRSLSRRGFNILMGLLGFLSVVVGVVFLSHGAWPVVGFFGLDVLVLLIAFRASYRSARAFEEVTVSRSSLVIRKGSAKGQVRDTVYNPFFARLQIHRHREIGVTRMAVTARGSTTELGAFLNPDDRESFAGAFGSALAKARGG